MGNDIWFAHGSNRAAGVAILKGTFKGHVLSHETDNSGRLVILEVNVDQSHYILVNLYATNSKQQNKIFWGNIELKLMQIKNKFPDAKIIWGGDFNCVHNDLLDRWPLKEDGMCEIKNVCLCGEGGVGRRNALRGERGCFSISLLVSSLLYPPSYDPETDRAQPY